MAWRLEIHHIDVIGPGDATLIIAREIPPLIGAVPIVRSVLIDGGKMAHWPALHAYLGVHLGGAPLSAMISTHYDDDHLGGLVGLLTQPGRYDKTFIYDRGWPEATRENALYYNYLRAINGLGVADPAAALPGVALARTRVTNMVRADGVKPDWIPPELGLPAVPAGAPNSIFGQARWLLSLSAPSDPLWHGWDLPIPPDAPTMRFIAANRYVLAPGTTPGLDYPTGPFIGRDKNPENEKSLAVEVASDYFRYYTGGAIESAQEDQLGPLLNPSNDSIKRMLAFKVSNHGAKTATSRGFVDRLRPDAAFISCGTASPDPPAQETINVLEGYPALNRDTPPVPPQPPNRPIMYYLTGYEYAGDFLYSYGSRTSMTAGDPRATPPIRGHIVLTVGPQSTGSIDGRLWTATQDAAAGALATGPLGGGLAALVDTIGHAAADAALAFGPGPAAETVINLAGGPAAAAAAARAAADGPVKDGYSPAASMAIAVTAAALGVVPAPAPAVAAGAGAAAGACYGGGTRFAILTAVYAALTTAGVADVPAQVAAATIAAGAEASQLITLFSVRFHRAFGGLVTISHE